LITILQHCTQKPITYLFPGIVHSLVDEIERIRQHWKQAEDHCQALEARCQSLESKLEMEREENKRMSNDDSSINPELEMKEDKHKWTSNDDSAIDQESGMNTVSQFLVLFYIR
jgi:predicted RNase H-like nuclease (RuvC/YqgF family)